MANVIGKLSLRGATATKQSHEIASLFVRNDSLSGVNLVKAFTIAFPFRSFGIGVWNLFVIWDLLFGICPWTGRSRNAWWSGF